MAIDAPDALQRRNHALAALAAIDGPPLARLWRDRDPRFVEVVEQVSIAEDRLVGLPRPLGSTRSQWRRLVCVPQPTGTVRTEQR